MSLAACRPGPGPAVSHGTDMPTNYVDPGDSTGTSEPGLMPTISGTDHAQPPVTPGQSVPGINPTRLPEPHLVHILDWEIVTTNSNNICAGCEADHVVIPAPRDLGIAVVRIFINGNARDAAAVESDLAFSASVDCRVKSSGGYCGLIFGQVKDGVLNLRAQHVAGETHQLTYYITFQNWADYTPP